MSAGDTAFARSKVRLMDVRRSPLAGSWYPAEAATLRDLVDGLLEGAAPQDIERSHNAFVVPHAGYQFSGLVAAAAYRLVADLQPKRVVVLAPCHRMSFRGLAVPTFGGFRTPLGTVWVDDVARSLASSELVRMSSSPFEGEHSFEIQLPFLQCTAADAKVVPILFGSLGPQHDSAIEHLLSRLADERTLFLISSDFTHYGRRFDYEPFPATSAEDVRTRLEELDTAAIEPILLGDAEGFRAFLARTSDTVCGRLPLAAFLATLGRGVRGRLLAYRTSLDVTGDFEHSVSYASIALGAVASG
jgi:MEMO1 family protein